MQQCCWQTCSRCHRYSYFISCNVVLSFLLLTNKTKQCKVARPLLVVSSSANKSKSCEVNFRNVGVTKKSHGERVNSLNPPMLLVARSGYKVELPAGLVRDLRAQKPQNPRGDSVLGCNYRRTSRTSNFWKSSSEEPDNIEDVLRHFVWLSQPASQNKMFAESINWILWGTCVGLWLRSSRGIAVSTDIYLGLTREAYSRHCRLNSLFPVSLACYRLIREIPPLPDNET